MTTIQSVSNSPQNYESIEMIEKTIDKSDEQKVEEQGNCQVEVDTPSIHRSSATTQGGSMPTEAVVEKHLTEVSDYAQKIKDKIKVTELQDSEHYGNMALEVKRIIESLIGVVTEEDVQNVIKENYNPEKLSIDMLARVINQNKLAYKTNDFEKIQQEVDEAVEIFKSKFSNMENLKQAISSLKENNLPINQKNIDKIIQVVEKVEEVKSPNNQTLVNLLKQNKEITIESLYKAKYMAENALDTKEDLKVLEPQIKSLLKESSLDVNKENIQLSKMLIKNDIPLNEETLTKIKKIKEELKNIDFETIIHKAAENIASKKPAAAITLMNLKISESNDDNNNVKTINYDELRELVDSLQDIEMTHIENVANKNQTIHLRALIDEVEQIKQMETHLPKEWSEQKDIPEEIKPEIISERDIRLLGSVSENLNNFDVRSDEQNQESEKTLKIIKASLQMEEIRLKMTFEVANRLSEKGIRIDTEPLENVVNHLREMERETYKNQLVIHNIEVTDEQIAKIENVYEKIDLIRNVPPKVFAKVINQEIDFTIKELANETRSELVIEKAMRNYELLGTKPRRDLGDRVEKTFNQIEGLLKDLQVEPTLSNIRAAKILAKNEMPLTIENLESIKLIDIKVIQITEKLNPNIVVKMIKEQLSPVDMHVDEVLEYMADFNTSMGVTTEEQIETAIFALDTNKSLTSEERESLIGIYRMFSTIAKSQGTAVGFLLKNNLSLSLNNLFEAAKYIKQAKSDSIIKVDVDDDFGILKEINYEGKPIKEQIETAISKENSVPTKSIMNLIEGLVDEDIDINSYNLRQALVCEKLFETCFDQITYEKMIKLCREGYFNKESINIEQMTEQLSEIHTEQMTEQLSEIHTEQPKQEAERVDDLISKIKNLAHINIDTLKTLESYGMNKTLGNLSTANLLDENGFTLLEKLDNLIEDIKTLKKDNINELPFQVAFSKSKTSHPIESYEKDIDQLKKQLIELKSNLLDYQGVNKVAVSKNIDQVVQLLDFQKMFKSNDDYYQIPFMIGDKLSQINMYYFRDRKGQTSDDMDSPMNIHLYFHTENMGKVQANIRLVKDRLDFNVYTDDSEDMNLIKSFGNKIKEVLSHTDFIVGNIDYGFFEGKSPIQEAIKPIVQEKTRKHQESLFETII